MKQTTGSYDTTYNNTTKFRQCLIITPDSLRSDKANSDTQVIKDKMGRLNFQVHFKTTANLFTKTTESNQDNGGTETGEKQTIDIKACK